MSVVLSAMYYDLKEAWLITDQKEDTSTCA